MAGENVFLHIKGDITWIGVYSKKKPTVKPAAIFWEDPKGIPSEELPPELSPSRLKEVSEGQHLKLIDENVGPKADRESHFSYSYCL